MSSLSRCKVCNHTSMRATREADRLCILCSEAQTLLGWSMPDVPAPTLEQSGTLFGLPVYLVEEHQPPPFFSKDAIVIL